MAEDEGFEPPQTESESGVLPLHKSSKHNNSIIHNPQKKSSTFLKKYEKFLLCQLGGVSRLMLKPWPQTSLT